MICFRLPAPVRRFRAQTLLPQTSPHRRVCFRAARMAGKIALVRERVGGMWTFTMIGFGFCQGGRDHVLASTRAFEASIPQKQAFACCSPFSLSLDFWRNYSQIRKGAYSYQSGTLEPSIISEQILEVADTPDLRGGRGAIACVVAAHRYI